MLFKDGRWEEAIEYYRGPFLDGFHLPGAGEFEEWASRERTRFGRLAWEVLENLAGAAEKSGAWDLAVRWRSRQVVLEPCSSLATLRLMRARRRGTPPAPSWMPGPMQRHCGENSTWGLIQLCWSWQPSCVRKSLPPRESSCG
jgi:hypothetical protein